MPLDLRSRSLIRISSLAARPTYREQLHDELRHLKDHASANREEVYEALLQLYLFAGFPAALEALRVLSKSWPAPTANPIEVAENATKGYELHRQQGETLYKRVYADNADRVRQEMLKLSPELAAWAVIEGYGKTLSRPGLDAITRELCIVGILTQLGWERQLFSHLLGARNVGATTEELAEAAVIGSLGNSALLEAAEQLIKKVV